MSDTPRRQDGPRPGPVTRVHGPVHDALERLEMRVRLMPVPAEIRRTSQADLAVVAAALDLLRGATNAVVHIDLGGPPFHANAHLPVSGDRLQTLLEAYEASR